MIFTLSVFTKMFLSMQCLISFCICGISFPWFCVKVFNGFEQKECCRPTLFRDVTICEGLFIQVINSCFVIGKLKATKSKLNSSFQLSYADLFPSSNGINILLNCFHISLPISSCSLTPTLALSSLLFFKSSFCYFCWLILRLIFFSWRRSYCCCISISLSISSFFLDESQIHNFFSLPL